MSLHVIIPVKLLDRSKLRLSRVLDGAERRDLSIHMLRDVLRSVSSADSVVDTVVVSSDPDVLAVASVAGATPLREPEPLRINESVSYANDFCMNRGASETLVLPADIPMLRPQDILNLAIASEPGPSVVITPSIRKDGTNALLRRPPHNIPTAYDSKSYPTHIRYTSSRHIRLVVLRLKTIMLDLDIPPDLEVFLKRNSDTESHRYLARILPERF